MKARLIDIGVYEIFCPGCNGTHHIPVSKVDWAKTIWRFNGNKAEPSFFPSCTFGWDSEVKSGKSIPGGLCHFLVTDGKVKYAMDCTHSLAGHTVDLPELPAYNQN